MIQCSDAVKYFATVKKEDVFQALVVHWKKILEIVEILEIPYITTQSVQSTKFALSDFYGCWLKMIIQLKNRITSGNDETNLAETLINSLDGRKKDLLNHPAMIMATFMDPRFYYELNEYEKNFARLNLKHVWVRITQTRNLSNESLNMNEQQMQSKDYLEDYFIAKGQPRSQIDENLTTRNPKEPNFNISEDDFMISVEKYEKELPRIHHSCSILDYWNDKLESSLHIQNLVELKMVANIIFGIPSTQTSCERNFSDLNFIFTSKRTRLNPKLLEDILFIRTNRNLFNDVKKEDLKKASNSKINTKLVQLTLNNNE